MWPQVGRLYQNGPLPELFAGQYTPEQKSLWQPWVDAARAGACEEELAKLVAEITGTSLDET